MGARRVHFPRTTPSQRRLLFQTWEATGDVALACRTAHVGQRTFYYWKPRFEAGGYAALATFASHARRTSSRTSPAIAARVIAARQQHPDWGKQRIADELAKGNNWVPLVSPNTVKRILREAGLWPPPGAPAPKGGPAVPAAPPSSPARP
jgi:transposase